MSDKGTLLNPTDFRSVPAQAPAPAAQDQQRLNLADTQLQNVSGAPVTLAPSAGPGLVVDSRIQRRFSSIFGSSSSTPPQITVSRMESKPVNLDDLILPELKEFFLESEVEAKRRALLKNRQTLAAKIISLKEQLVEQKELLNEKQAEIRKKKTCRNLFKYMFYSSYRKTYRNQRQISNLEKSTLQKEVKKTEQRIAKYSHQQSALDVKSITLSADNAEDVLLQESMQQTRIAERAHASVELQLIMQPIWNLNAEQARKRADDQPSITQAIESCNQAQEKLELLLTTLQQQGRQIRSNSNFITRSKADRQELAEIKKQIKTTQKAQIDIRSKKAAYTKAAICEDVIPEDIYTDSPESELEAQLSHEIKFLFQREASLEDRLESIEFTTEKFASKLKETTEKLTELDRAWQRRALIDHSDPKGNLISFKNAHEAFKKETAPLLVFMQETPEKQQFLSKQKMIEKRELSELKTIIRKTQALAIVDLDCLTESDPSIQLLKQTAKTRAKLNTEIAELWDSKKQELSELDEINIKIEKLNEEWKVERSDSSIWKRWRNTEHKEEYKLRKVSYDENIQPLQEAKLEKQKKLKELENKLANKRKELSSQLREHKNLHQNSEFILRQKISRLTQPAMEHLKSFILETEAELSALKAEKEDVNNPPSLERAKAIDISHNALQAEKADKEKELQSLVSLSQEPASKKVLAEVEILAETVFCCFREVQRQSACHERDLAIEAANIEITSYNSVIDSGTSTIEERINASACLIDKNKVMQKATEAELNLLMEQRSLLFARSYRLTRSRADKDELSIIKAALDIANKILIHAKEEIAFLEKNIMILGNI